MKKLLFVCVSLALCSGCVERKDRSFFADQGIRIGTPEPVGEESVFIPITFETRIVHSAQWLYDVKWREDGGRIQLTALFSVPPDGRKSVYAGGITLERPRRSSYTLEYRDSGGKTHELGDIQIPGK